MNKSVICLFITIFVMQLFAGAQEMSNNNNKETIDFYELLFYPKTEALLKNYYESSVIIAENENKIKPFRVSRLLKHRNKLIFSRIHVIETFIYLPSNSQFAIHLLFENKPIIVDSLLGILNTPLIKASVGNDTSYSDLSSYYNWEINGFEIHLDTKRHFLNRLYKTQEFMILTITNIFYKDLFKFDIDPEAAN